MASTTEGAQHGTFGAHRCGSSTVIENRNGPPHLLVGAANFHRNGALTGRGQKRGKLGDVNRPPSVIERSIRRPTQTFETGGREDDDDRHDKELDKSDVTVAVGLYRFRITQEDFIAWCDRVKQDAGFDKESVLNEIRSRLGL